MQDHLYILLKKLVVNNNIVIHQDELKLQLQSHPSYPSLHSVTGVLDHLNIPNAAIRTPQTVAILEQLPKHFIAVTQDQANEDIVLVTKGVGTVKLKTSSGHNKTITNTEFIDLWNGIVVAVEGDTNTNTNARRFSHRTTVFAVGMVALLGVSLYAILKATAFNTAHFLLSILGFAISILIVKHDLGLQTQIENSFCNLSKTTSCEAVLNGKGSSLFGKIKLSDLSIVTFLGYLISVLIGIASNVHIEAIIRILSLGGLMAAVYSIYYQAFSIKKWCPLCLGIVGVLLLQATTVFVVNTDNTVSIISLQSLLVIAISFALSVSAWFYLKSLIKNQKEFRTLAVKHQSFKRKFSIFNTLYNQEEKLESNPSIANELVFGNIHAPITITLVTSPFCFYCKAAHRDIMDILHNAKNDIKLQIRFMADPEQSENALYKIVSEVLHIYHTQGPQASLNILDILYKDGTDLNEWILKTNIHYNPSYDKVMSEQVAWSEANKINFTPAFYVNDRSLPQEYDRKDILLFLEELTEQHTINRLGALEASKIAS